MRFLVTAIGSFSAECVVRTLKDGNNYVVGCDIYEGVWHPTTKYCDAFYKAPLAKEEIAYVNFLSEISDKERIDYIIPLTDVEIDVLNRRREDFVSKGITLCMPSSDCLHIFRNKFRLYQEFVNDERVNVPRSARSEELHDVEDFVFPLIAKPVDGRSSEGLFRIGNKEEMSGVSRFSTYIVQEIVLGTVCTVDYVRDSAGHDFAVPREELLRTKNGAGTTVRILISKALSETVSYIGQKLDVCGCINMEFVFDASEDKYYLIDVNPRFSAGVAFTKLVGYDMVTSHVNCFSGKSILPPITYEEQIVAKRYVEEVLWKK